MSKSSTIFWMQYARGTHLLLLWLIDPLENRIRVRAIFHCSSVTLNCSDELKLGGAVAHDSYYDLHLSLVKGIYFQR